VLDALGCRDERSILDITRTVLLQPFAARGDEPLHPGRATTSWLYPARLEDELEPLALYAGLLEVLVQGELQVWRRGCRRQLRQRIDDLPFGRVEILQFLDVQVLQRCGHQ